MRDQTSPATIPIKHAALSCRAYGVLLGEGFDNMLQVHLASDAELLTVPNLGKATLREIRVEIARLLNDPEGQLSESWHNTWTMKMRQKYP